MNNEIAETILHQLGGNKFLVMTGSKNLTYSNDGLNMKLSKNISGANWLRITLNSMDTYDMRFYKVTGGKLNTKTFEISPIKNKDIKIINNVYCKQLQEIFKNVTGLDTHL